jgi:ATP-dependent DNA helicase RecG
MNDQRTFAIPEMLVLTERVRNTIALGKSHFREFKSALDGPPGKKQPRSTKRICEDIAEALVAFANADSGELLVGVEDDGTITGVPHTDEEVRLLLDAPRTHILHGQSLPLMSATPLILDDKRILFFSVAKGTSEVYQLAGGACKRRSEKETLPASARQIQFDRAEIRSREYDREFVDGATVNDLDISLLQNAANSYIKGLGMEYYLQQVGLAEYGPGGLRLRRAALLLYAKDIQRWVPHSHVRILRISGTELKSGELYNVTLDEMVVGNISSLLVNGWHIIRPFLAYKTDFGPDARFEQKYIYPELACQEALVNAIAHRDYTVSSGIEVYIFDDRLEIRNPGSLLSTLSIDDLRGLKGVHESRNALIAKILRENNKVMRELGEGMRRMFDLMFENELKEPSLQSDGGSFTITLNSKSAFSMQQEQWLLMFQQFNLTPLQKRIMVAGMGDRQLSPEDIYKAMGTGDRDTYDRELTSLRVAGLMVSTRSNQNATAFAEKNMLSKRKIPRFKVQIPGINPEYTEEKSAEGEGPPPPKRSSFGDKTSSVAGASNSRIPAKTTSERIRKRPNLGILNTKAPRHRRPLRRAGSGTSLPQQLSKPTVAPTSPQNNSIMVSNLPIDMSHSEIRLQFHAGTGVLQIRKLETTGNKASYLLRYANEATALEVVDKSKGRSILVPRPILQLQPWG